MRRLAQPGEEKQLYRQRREEIASKRKTRRGWKSTVTIPRVAVN